MIGLQSLRPWLRAQRAWLIGCAVVAPAVLLWTSWDAWADYSRWRPLLGTDVAAGASGSLGGADWRLGSVEILEPKELDLGRILPENAVVLVAHFTMTPTPGADQTLLASCGGRLSDANGRHWDEYPIELIRLRVGEPRGCVAEMSAAAGIRSAPPGAPWHFAHAYLVPSDAALASRPEIILPKLQPRYLSFQRR